MTLSLTEIADRFATDKGKIFGNGHNYTPFYEFLLEQWRNVAFSMLEIGLQRGDLESYTDPGRLVTDAPSVRMWLEYFPRIHCFGFDLADFSAIALDRFTFVRGDLSSVADLRAAADLLPPLRLVIDDGSHASWHQQRAFACFFPRLEPGGLYIIEDLDTQSPLEAVLPVCRKTADVFVTMLSTGELDLAGEQPVSAVKLKNEISGLMIHRGTQQVEGERLIKMVAIQKKLVIAAE